MKKWQSWILAAIAIFVVFLSGCGPKEPIRIGFAGGFTGNNSSVAISGRDAIQMAIQEVNRKGGLLGRQVELVSKDDKSDPEQTKAVDAEFIKEKVPVVIGHLMSGVAPAMMEAIKGQDILMVSPTISAASVSGLDDNFMRTILTNSDQGSYLASYIREKAHKSRMMILYSNTNKTFVDGMKQAVGDTFKSMGGTVVHEARIDEKDTKGMEAAIAEGVRQQADSVVLIMNAGDVAMFSQLLLKDGGNFSVYSGTWGMTADVIRMGGKAVEGIIFPAQFDPSSTNASYQKFSKEYQTLYGQIPDLGAVYSYDSAQVIFKAIRLAGSTEPEKIKEAIIKQRTFKGLQQDFVINATGDVVCPHFTIVVKDGRFVNIDSAQ